ncbi:MAG: CPBP family intramembrane glutamic endopeptidase [Synechococcus sp.]
MQTLQAFFLRYSLRRALVVFALAQLLGTGLTLGLANTVPLLIAIPGSGIELLRGLPALLIIIAVGVELLGRRIDPREELRLVFQRISRADVAALVLFNLAIGMVSILVVLLSLHQVSPAQPSSMAALGIAAVTSTTLAPISEEIVFRGWLFNGLKRRFQVWPAILLSSLAFAAIHPSISLITTFVFGVLVAIAYEKTQNIWVSILIHALNNLLISAQAIAEHMLISAGLAKDSTDLSQLALVLGLPSVLLMILLGRYLIRQKQFFNLLVPLRAGQMAGLPSPDGP